MKKILLGTLLGLLLIFAGIYAFYNYLTELSTNNNLLIFGLSVVLITPGVYILFRAGSLNAYKLNLEETPAEKNGKKQETLIEKNSRLVEEWRKTTDQADKLKLLGLRAAAEEKK